MQNFGVTNKEHYMVCYGIFLSGQLIRLISLMNSFAASGYGLRICLLEFAIVLKLKNNNKNFNEEMLRLQMNQPWECGLINPNLFLFDFFQDNVIAIRCIQ